MPTVNWDETDPANSKARAQGAADIRSAKTSVRNAMGAEHNFPATGGADTGYHLLGSARPYYGVQSAVSSSGTDGRLMVTSDTSRLFHVGSAGTMYLGDARTISAGSVPVGGQRFYWAFEMQMVPGNGSGSGLAVTFPNSGYSGLPFVVASLWSDGIGNSNSNCVAITLRALTATGVTLIPMRQDNTVVNPSVNSYMVYSMGTRTL